MKKLNPISEQSKKNKQKKKDQKGMREIKKQIQSYGMSRSKWRKFQAGRKRLYAKGILR